MPQEDIAAYPREGVVRIVLQFFVFPLLLVGSCVALFVFVRWLVGSPRTPSELLRDIRTGSSRARWQSAYELARLSHFDERVKKDPFFLSQLLLTYGETAKSDPLLRRYLVFILASIHDPHVDPLLIQAIDDPNSLTAISAMLAIAQNKRKRFVGSLISLFPGADAERRKTMVYVLGTLGARQSIPLLVNALHDAVQDVRWNAAIALARLGQDEGRDVLLQLLDRSYLQNLREQVKFTDSRTGGNDTGGSKALKNRNASLLSTQDVEDILVNTLKSIFFLPNKKIFLQRVTFLSQHDPDAQVRALAQNLLRDKDE